jgi:hypothetical protein
MSLLRDRMTFIVLQTLAVAFATDSVEANHRRNSCTYRAAPQLIHPCPPQFINAGVRIQTQMANLQSAAIPPALVPILMNVGQDLGQVALEQLIAILRRKLQERGFSFEDFPGAEGYEDDHTSDFEDLNRRLDALENRLKETQPDLKPNNRRLGSIDIPTEIPRRNFPVFR